MADTELLRIIEAHCVDLNETAAVLRAETFLQATADEMDKAAAELRAATKAAAPADAPKLDADELARLRRVVHALDMEKAVPQDDATLSGCLFSVLGMIAYELERRASSTPAIPGTGGEKEQWQPISNAPRDGSQIILANGVNVAQGWFVDDPKVGTEVIRDSEGRYVDEVYHEGYQGWLDCEGGMLPEPTHWMPLPAAPSHPLEAKAGEDAPKSCWSCKREYTAEQRLDADGNCPHCGVEIEEAGEDA